MQGGPSTVYTVKALSMCTLRTDEFGLTMATIRVKFHKNIRVLRKSCTTPVTVHRLGGTLRDTVELALPNWPRHSFRLSVLKRCPKNSSGPEVGPQNIYCTHTNSYVPPKIIRLNHFIRIIMHSINPSNQVFLGLCACLRTLLFDTVRVDAQSGERAWNWHKPLFRVPVRSQRTSIPHTT